MNHCVDHDPLREIRSMALAAFPCPPLPQLALREEHGVHSVISSHDVIATGLQATLNSGLGPEQEAPRANAQRMLQQLYNNRLDLLYTIYCTASGQRDEQQVRRQVVGEVYDAMQNFTRRYIAAYMGTPSEALRVVRHDAALPDVRFRDIDDVCVGDEVHRRAVDHLVALRTVVGCEQRTVSSEELQGLPYRAVVERFFVMYSQDGEDEAQQAAQAGGKNA